MVTTQRKNKYKKLNTLLEYQNQNTSFDHWCTILFYILAAKQRILSFVVGIFTLGCCHFCDC